MIVAIIFIGVAVLVLAFVAVSSSMLVDHEVEKVNGFITLVDSRLDVIEKDIKRLKDDMTANENSHGVLSLMIQEISAAEKIGELRKEVLRMKEDV